MNSAKSMCSAGVVALSLLLAGCGSDSPSSSEVSELIEAEQKIGIELMNNIGGSQASGMLQNAMPKFEGAEVVSCEEIQERLSRCVVEIEVSMKGQKNRTIVTQNFVHGSDGKWAIAQ